jgi:Integrase
VPRSIRIKITTNIIERYADNLDVRELVDTYCSGLLFRYKKNRTSGSWFAYIYEGGRMRSSVFAYWPTHSVDVARAHVAAEVDKLMGRKPEQTQLSQFTYLHELLDWFCERVSKQTDISPARKKSIHAVVTNRITPLIGNVALGVLDAKRLDAQFWMPLQSKYALSTVNLTLRILKQAVTFAHVQGMIATNPLASIRQSTFTRQTIPHKEGRIKPYQVRLVTSVITELNEQTMLCLMLLLFGSRIGETRRASIHEFDIEGQVWHVPDSHTKSNRGYQIALGELGVRLINAYRRYQQAHNYFGTLLFPAGLGRAIGDREASRYVSDVSKRAWSAHDLRKLFRTRIGEQGTQYVVCEAMINHALSKMDQTYILSIDGISAKRVAIKQYHQWLLKSGLDIAGLLL